MSRSLIPPAPSPAQSPGPSAPSAWYDQQYNARAGIPGAAQWLQAWAARSHEVRTNHSRALLDLPYTPAGRVDPAQRLDVFLPDTAWVPSAPEAPAPLLVHLHGGYWRSLDKRDQSFLAPAFNASGAVVVIPNYALCPAASLREIVLQMVAALAFCWRHAPAWGADRSRLMVTGHSAGGHLAAMLACCQWRDVAGDLPPDVVKTVVTLSGLFDLEPLRLAPFLASDIRLDAAEAGRLSPARLPPPASGAQVLCFVGAEESAEFHRQNGLLQAAWGVRQVPVVDQVPGCHHLGIMDALADPGSDLHAAVMRALVG